MVETWKDIPGYGGKYQANTEGEVRRVQKGGKVRLMTPYHKKTGSRKVVIKLSRDGRSKEVKLMQVIARTFLGPCPPEHTAYHRNGIQSDNYVNNLAYIPIKELGKLTGASSRRRPVAKLDAAGEVIEIYTSARAAADANYCSRQTVADRCNGKVKTPLGNMDFAWDDSERSMKLAKERLSRNCSGETLNKGNGNCMGRKKENEE